MKNHFAASALAVLLTCTALQFKAQDSTFNQGAIVLNAGIGFGTRLYTGNTFSSLLPPLSVSVEYGLEEDFLADNLTLGIGGYVGIARAKSEFLLPDGNRYGWEYGYTVIGVRVAAHYPLVDKLDTYGGLMLSYNAVHSKPIGNVPQGSVAESGTAGLSLYVGGRYYFKDSIAAMAEVGYGVSFLNLGVAFRL